MSEAVENIQYDEVSGEVDAVDNTDMAPETTEQKPVETPKQQNAPAVPETLMDLDERGLVAPKDSSEAWRLAGLFLKSKAIPKQFVNVAQVFMARQFLLAQGLNPEIAIRQTTIINGTLSIWGDLPLAICQRSGLIETFEEYLIDKDYNKIHLDNKNLDAEIFAGVCRTKRKGHPEIIRTFTVKDAQTAGLLSKNGSLWNIWPKRMYQMRVRSLVLKDAYSDVLSGIAINEYDYDILQDNGAPRDLLPMGPKNAADELNKEFGEPVTA
jgi:hypothetical protein